MDIRIHNSSESRARPALVVLLKAPANAKRRLAAEIGDLAAEAAGHLCACALEDALAWSGPTWLSPADPHDRNWLSSAIAAEVGRSCRSGQSPLAGDRPGENPATQPDGISGLVPQCGGNLGDRVNHVDRELRRQGAGKILFVGSDCPGLDAAYLEQAGSELDRADAVLGPALDGGVVLMGARRPWPDLGCLSWSTEGFCAQLAGLCRGLGWRVATLGVREDIDTLSDLLRAAATLQADERPARRGLAEWLNAHRDTLLSRSRIGMAQHLHGEAETRPETTP